LIIATAIATFKLQSGVDEEAFNEAITQSTQFFRASRAFSIAK
jgi:hypothetical protein